MTDDDALITLDEAAKLIPDADADTLKRMHRAGKLVCYRPGKKLLTTAANVREAVQACRVTPVRAAQGRPDAASMERSNAALDLALENLRRIGQEKKQAARVERDRANLIRKAERDAERRAARKAARAKARPPRTES
ncbi:hypothetical protein BjapCC829_22870 [Bradyrhizobium barranii]|uniref:Helix-turn-helix domain-containing protein n=1 Tax=Bradyrhizobium barranii TaxID=2992140 RepID=A0ABY3QAJ4_9BRAD|nr:hypothetical protein [Bradyrhizobium japonicum]UFW82835.1 hypothetical protein BjapCC829_22870 [Bradyrhizobium japonicum]